MSMKDIAVKVDGFKEVYSEKLVDKEVKTIESIERKPQGIREMVQAFYNNVTYYKEVEKVTIVQQVVRIEKDTPQYNLLKELYYMDKGEDSTVKWLVMLSRTNPSLREQVNNVLT